MENYVPSGEEEEIQASPSFPTQFTQGVPVMKIKKNTKFGGIIDRVRKQFEDPASRHVIFEGIGEAADKCISCVEVFKRGSTDPVYQWNALQTAKRIIFWDPIVEGLDRLKVTVDTPVMYILISRDPFPVEFQCLSMQCSTDSSVSTGGPERKSKKPTGGQRGGRQNKWVRPEKGDLSALMKEREEIVNSIKADS